MDGRVQTPVTKYLSTRFGADFVDVITEAGPVGVLAENPDSVEAHSIFHRVEVSIDAHASVGLAIAAHHDCAGNPVPEDQQIQQLEKCRKILYGRFPDMEVVCMWLDSSWKIHEI
jgi:hypothetical protein